MTTKKKYDHTVIIQREKWANGFTRNTFNHGNKLLNGNGTMCCMGFACVSLGVPKYKIQDQGFPSNVSVKLPVKANQNLLYWLVSRQYSLSVINDGLKESATSDKFSSVKELEAAVKQAFSEKNILVKFIGKYPRILKIKKNVE